MTAGFADIGATVPQMLVDEADWKPYRDALRLLLNSIVDPMQVLYKLRVPEETPYPNVLARDLGAYLSTFDTPDDVRRKCMQAVNVHKNNADFDLAWKPILDAIMGTDTRIWRGKWTQGGFRVGIDYVGLKPVGGAGGLTVGSSTVGDSYVGGPRPPYLDWAPGDVLIDLVNEPTETQTRRIRAQFVQQSPTYMRVWTGTVQTLFGDYLAGDYLAGDYLTEVEVFVVADFLNKYQYVNWKP